MQRPSPDAERPHVSCWRQLGGTVATIFVVVVLANYLWELAQAPLYVSMESFRAVWWHCFVASLGDGLNIGLGRFPTEDHCWWLVRHYESLVAANAALAETHRQMAQEVAQKK